MNAMARISPYTEPGRLRCADAAMDGTQEVERPLEALLFWLPSLLKREPTPFVRGFVLSILARSKRRGWAPSDKQLALMRRLVSDMFDAADGGDFDVIDRDG